jgi:hypothetical protein
VSGSGVKNVGFGPNFQHVNLFGPYFQHVNLSLARLQCQLLLVAQNFKDIFVLFPPLPLLLRQETKSHTLTSSTLKYKRFLGRRKSKSCAKAVQKLCETREATLVVSFWIVPQPVTPQVGQ